MRSCAGIVNRLNNPEQLGNIRERAQSQNCTNTARPFWPLWLGIRIRRPLLVRQLLLQRHNVERVNRVHVVILTYDDDDPFADGHKFRVRH